MHATAELIGATATLVGLGILTLASARSISRRWDTGSDGNRAQGCRRPTARV
jgi:hypothetical protein